MKIRIVINNIIPFKGFKAIEMSIEDIIEGMLSLEELPPINSEEWLKADCLENEVWVDIPGYENVYLISCYGRILSLDRMFKRGKGYYVRSPKILKLKNSPYEYYKINLYHPITGSKSYAVHRLVAISFYGHHEGKVVNHRDENRKNPLLSNLEWITQRQNCLYGNAIEKMKKTFENNGITKSVALLSQSGSILKTYKSIKEAANDLNLCSTGICRACKNHKKYDGLIFRYLKDLKVL